MWCDLYDVKFLQWVHLYAYGVKARGRVSLLEPNYTLLRLENTSTFITKESWEAGLSFPLATTSVLTCRHKPAQPSQEASTLRYY